MSRDWSEVGSDNTDPWVSPNATPDTVYTGGVDFSVIITTDTKDPAAFEVRTRWPPAVLSSPSGNTAERRP